MSTDEKKRFVNAFLTLKTQDSILHPGAQSRYDDFVETHLLAMHDMDTHAMRPVSWGHSGSVFLPWHRELLYQFEQLLQDIDATVTIPYWDWTRAKGSADAGYPFTHDFLGVDGTDGDDDRVKREPGAPSPYPYAFDPEAWSSDLIVFDPDDSLNFFQRQFGEFIGADPDNNAPGLPSNDVVETGTNTTFRDAISGSINYLTHRARCEDLHNLVHRYCNGSMLRMTSPNDPIFFLHHANIDRMWSIWQAKVAAGTDLYVQSRSTLGHKLNDAMLFHEPGDPAPFPTGATPAQMINGHAIHGVGVWYQSDIPEIDAPAPSLSFIDIPEGLTSYKAVKFKIKGGREVRFRITANPGGAFSLTPMGSEFKATPVDEDDFYYGYVWVQLTAAAGAVANSSVSIHTYLIDDEGYYTANEGDEYPLGDYTITLNASVVPRENNAVALVLDRSGSMSANAGGSSTRSQLLGTAIEVFRDLMLPGDQISVTTFDDVVDTPIPMQTVSSTPPFNTIDITPRNNTWIGGGILGAVPELNNATHTNRSMLVLTDGNENVHPYIAELPSGIITNRTYAIGFGLPGQVSDEALNDITSNTNGDLIITGNISSEEQRFHLTKYFVQVLAGVTNSQVILDPEGKLYYGTTDTIPFKVTEADVYVDAILLCPIPQFVEFVLQTPGGDIIKPESTEPNVQWIAGNQVLCYRMVLPAIISSAIGSHAGKWHAILQLKDQREIAQLQKRSREWPNNSLSHAVRKFLPYSFLVHTSSNLRMDAWKVQKETIPGSIVEIHVSLKAYDVPFQKGASVRADVTAPDLSTQTIKLKHIGGGRYSTSYATSLSGVYTFRLLAEGLTAVGSSWTREKTLTAGVFRNGGGKDENGNGSSGSNDRLCEWLRCILKDQTIIDERLWKRLQEKGIDVKRLLACITKPCHNVQKEYIPRIQREMKEDIKNWELQTIADVSFDTAAVPSPAQEPVKRRKRPDIKEARKSKFQTMFTALDLEKEEQCSDDDNGSGGHEHGQEHGH